MRQLRISAVAAAISIFSVISIPIEAEGGTPVPQPPNGYRATFDNATGIGASYANGQTFENLFDGWTNAAAEDAFVTNLFDVLDAASSNSYFAANPKPIGYDHTNSSQVLCIEGGISNDFSSTPDLCYWVDMLINPTRWTEETEPGIGAGIHAGLYVNSNGALTVYCATNITPSLVTAWIPTDVTIGSNDWVRLTLKLLYNKSLLISGGHTFQVYVNGAAISNAYAYAGAESIGVTPPSGGKYFAMADSSATNISQIAFRNTAKLDDFVVTTNELVSQITHTITAQAAGGPGTVTPSGTVEVGDGFSQLFTFGGGTVENLVVDGTTNAAAPFYLFSNLTTDHTLTVIFAAVSGSTSNNVPHSWLAQFALPQDDAGGDGNTDGDGSDATTEYYFGTDPTNENSDATITKNWVLADGSQVICWLGGTNGSANPFQIWCSTNLSDGAAWTNIGVTAHADSGINYWTNTVADPRAFYEIRVSVP
ncbi:MAG: hypothetical protein O2901_06415 [Verrucomicrobia bacterium]|nr:hypothetical protein [Verrucomicrobiota bacterium]